MSRTAIAGLGALAGFTIFLGLPFGRVRNHGLKLRAGLNALALGILLFLFWDVLSQADDPLEHALLAAHTVSGWGRFAGLAAVSLGGLTIGLMSLVYYDAALTRRSAAGYERPASRLALMIAIGIGLHNFAEGLAIGQSAAAGQISLAVLLIVGFGLHNATEGFGIVGPLAGGADRPSWGLLGLLGLIAGGPTLVGTLIGQSFVNSTVYLGFLALAAGSILYVVIQLLRVAFRLGQLVPLYWGLLGGLLAGFSTDFVITAAGA